MGKRIKMEDMLIGKMYAFDKEGSACKAYGTVENVPGINGNSFDCKDVTLIWSREKKEFMKRGSMTPRKYARELTKEEQDEVDAFRIERALLK